MKTILHAVSRTTRHFVSPRSKRRVIGYRSFASNQEDSTVLPSEAFSVDLLQASRDHLAFLRQIHREQFFLAEQLYSPHQLVQPTPESYYAITEESVDRYLHAWLPLVAAHPEESLIPPHDIAWLWHCHRLAPQAYRQYTIQHFGKVLNPVKPFLACSLLSGIVWNKLATAPRTTYQQVQTQRLWNQLFPEREFLIDFHEMDPSAIVPSYVLHNDNSENESSSSSSSSVFDLVKSAHRQGTFLWQVSGKRFLQEPEFLRYAVSRYYAFLKLHERRNPKSTNEVGNENEHTATSGKDGVHVPTYQIDFMWHTHMLWSTTGYRVDCFEICGHDQGISHHDDFNDRTPGGPLETAWKKTSEDWSQKYQGQEYFVQGGMYRGEPPPRYYSRTWDPEEAIKEDETKRSNSKDDGGGAGCIVGSPNSDESEASGTGNSDGGDASSCGSSCGGGCGD